MSAETRSSLSGTWKAQIRQIAARNPRLAQQLWLQQKVYFDRYAQSHQAISKLPRRLRRKLLRTLGSSLAGAALLLALGQALPAYAALITVDGLTCTLAEAIDSANNDNAAGNGCVDGSGADTIDLQTGVVLSAPLPPITTEITLNGNGYAIDGDDNFRVLQVDASGDLTLNESVITGGDADEGAGVLNAGVLTVNNSVFVDNHATGYFKVGGGIGNLAGGTVVVNQSSFTGNSAGGGGGIGNSGTMQVFNSIFTFNWASGEFNGNGGGGISNKGVLTVDGSSLHGNSGYGGGGIGNKGTLIVQNSTINQNLGTDGGGIGIYYGSVIVTNSTISGNDADYYGGGVANFGGTLTINNSTVTGNEAQIGDGGGIFNGFTGILNLNHSLISGNFASPLGQEIFNQGGTVYVDNYNVFGFGGDPRTGHFTPGPSDVVPAGPLDSLLDPLLADNGGPTLTHALVPGSEAIDVAPNGPCLAASIDGYDQRGYPRNMDGDLNPSPNECDAGAFEFDPMPWKAYLPLITHQDADGPP